MNLDGFKIQSRYIFTEFEMRKNIASENQLKALVIELRIKLGI